MLRSRSVALLALLAVVAGAGPSVVVGQNPSAPAEGSPGAPRTVVDASGAEVVVSDASRTVTLGGVVTETAFALGASDQVVGVDASSSYPTEALASKAVLPYYRQLSAEPVLALAPTLVLGADETGPADVLAQLREAGVTTLLVPAASDAAGAQERIRAIGRALGREEAADELAQALADDLAAAAVLVSGATSAPRVLFVLLPPRAPLLVSGTGSDADTMIVLAGGKNAVTHFPGYIPLGPETVLAAAPDVILTTTSSLEAAGGIDGLLAVPGMAQTPAGAARRIVALDDLYLLGFGPRTGQAVAELARLLHPELGG